MKAYVLKLVLDGSNPEIWREIIIPEGFTFARLHKAIQIAMDWGNYHFYEFTYQGYKIPNARKIEEFFDTKRVLFYFYDFGDAWEIKVKKTKTLETYGNNFPVITAFAEQSPPEDCGGIYGYYTMLEIMSDPTHKEYEETKDWIENSAYGGDFDLETANERLKRMKPKKTSPA